MGTVGLGFWVDDIQVDAVAGADRLQPRFEKITFASEPMVPLGFY